MILSVEISLYPLKDEFIPGIDYFIDRLNSYSEIKVKTFATATIAQGEFDTLMDILKVEMKAYRQEYGLGIFVTKFLPDYETLT